MNRKLVPDVVKIRELILVPEDAYVLAVAKLMAEKKVGAVLVVNHGDLAGIVTERDLVTKVVARQLDPGSTEVGEIMSRNPDTLPATATAGEAIALMQEKHYRHLPITDGKKAVGIVSIRDLFALLDGKPVR